jgi:hypothetical protein
MMSVFLIPAPIPVPSYGNSCTSYFCPAISYESKSVSCLGLRQTQSKKYVLDFIHRDILQSFNTISKLKKSLRFERSNFFRLQLKGEEAPALFLPAEQAISDQWYRLQLGLTDPTEQVSPTFLPEDETRFILQNVVIS